MRRLLSTAMPPALFTAGVIALWYAVAQVVPETKKILLPSPHDLWFDSIADPAIRDEVMHGLVSTTRVALTGLVIGMLIGILIAVAMSQDLLIERALFPWAVVLQTIPTLALDPLIGVWFGFGFMSRVIVAVLIALFLGSSQSNSDVRAQPRQPTIGAQEGAPRRAPPHRAGSRDLGEGKNSSGYVRKAGGRRS